MRCDQCKFWRVASNQENDSDLSANECRRFPPHPIAPVMQEWAQSCSGGANVGRVVNDLLEVASYSWSWKSPRVEADHWCGEFQPKSEQ